MSVVVSVSRTLVVASIFTELVEGLIILILFNAGFVSSGELHKDDNDFGPRT